MKQYINGYRYRNYDKWNHKKNLPYDYEKNGLVNKILSRKIIESKNFILNIILQYYEKSFIFLMKYVDVLKYYKDPHWKNR